MATGNTFFHFRDDDGVDVIVQRLEEVPAKYRAQAQRLDMDKPPPSSSKNVEIERPADPVAEVAPPKEFWRAVHWPSFAVGAVISMTAGMVLFVLLRRRSRLLSMVIGLLAMVAFGVGYLTFLRRQVGLPPAGLATPATILDDARQAASAAQKRQQQDEKTLDQINNLR